VHGWNFQGNNKDVFNNATVDRHGTFVSGIVGAVGNNSIGVSGVAWHVKIMPLKFIDTTGDTADAIRAINYAIAQKKKGVNVRVINASWGPGRADCADSFSKSLRNAISAAGDAGILFVCSAGNGVCGDDGFGDNLDDAPEYPAAWAGELSNVISVGAVTRTDDLLYFSNYGHASVSVAAPGDGQVTSVFPGDGYGTWSPGGTSFSAPHVTGIAALLAAREPSLTPNQVKQRIISTAEPILSLASKTATSGRANAYNALTNHTPAKPALGIGSVSNNKKFVFIDGLGFTEGAMVVEVNGVAIGKSRYDETYALQNGTTTHIFVKLGKTGVKETFPQFQQVSVTVLNQQTGERSPVYSLSRR
jgi:subtilisin family serine protease